MALYKLPSLQFLLGFIKQNSFILQFLLGFLIITIYIPGILGASIPTGWFALIIIGGFFIDSISPFLIYATLSLAWTQNLNIAVFFLFQFIALYGIYCLGKGLCSLTVIFKGFTIGLFVSNLVALFFQSYIFSIGNAKAGLFVNPNIFSEVSAVILIALIVLELWWWMPLTLPGLILVHSRAALLSLFICSFIWLWKRDKFYSVIELLVVGLLVLLTFDHMKFTSIQERFDLWADTIRGFKIFGNGIGSFEILYPLNAINIDTSLARPRYAHNDLLQLIFEYGMGVVLLIPVIYSVLRSTDEKKLILYVIVIISLFTYPFHVPVIAFMGCLVAGYINRNNDTVWNCWNSSRSNLFKRITRKRFKEISTG